jgi:transcriptional regulator with XRE-family HTH domain
MRYGDQIRMAREVKGLSQLRAAKLAGVSRRYLSELENDKANVSVGVLVKVANALGIKELHFGTFTSHFASSATLMAVKLDEAKVLLTEVSRLIAPSAIEAPPVHEEPSLDSAGQAADDGSLPIQPFAGGIERGDLGRRTAASMPVEALLVREELFRAVDFSNPIRRADGSLVAQVLGRTMEPTLAQGEQIRINTAGEAESGSIVAIHTPMGSLLGRIGPGKVLLREAASPIDLDETCVILGTVERSA